MSFAYKSRRDPQPKIKRTTPCEIYIGAIFLKIYKFAETNVLHYPNSSRD